MCAQKLLPNLEQFTTFGDLLKFLRRRAGLTQRELALQVGYSHAQISRLELNQRLPDLATISARFVPALYLEDFPEAAGRLLELAAGMRREDAPASGVAPYKGLQAYAEADADLFFGRETLTARLVQRILQAASPAPGEAPAPLRLLAVVGASGSGKSSILRAGLIPMLRWNTHSAGWQIYTLMPSARPLQALAATLTQETASVLATSTLADDLQRDVRALHFYAQRLLQTGPGPEKRPQEATGMAPAAAQLPRLFLGVDQFEELFSLCHDEAERRAFIDNLLTAASEPHGPVTVALTLRADFYAQCAPYPRLRQALAEQQEYIGPLSSAELRRAIEEPARRGGWELEPGLVELLLKDLGADGPQPAEPGALPLLSHALVETWQRRRGRALTISGYLASGGVQGAIAETAEVVFQDELDSHQQGIARSIFLRLTELGDDEVPVETRRRAAIDELVRQPAEAEAVREVLTHLANARLVVTDQEVAEVAHEALIREWPTLRGWLEENREGLRLHRHLTLAAEGWQRQGGDPGELYRGARLAQALEWAQSQPGELNAQERQFLEASQAAAEREASEREAQRQHELQAAHTLAETQSRAAAQLRWRALYLAAALILALGMTAAALFFGQQARQNEQQALAATRLATTRELAASAINSLEVDPELGILLALQAISTTRTSAGRPLPEAEEALHRALLASHVRLVLAGHQQGVLTAAYRPDGQRVATIGLDGTVIVWEAARGEQLLRIPGATQPGDAIGSQRVAYSPDGRRLVSGDGSLVKVWEADSGAQLASLSGHTGEVWAVAFSSDGSCIASGGTDALVRVWDSATGELLLTLTGHPSAIETLAFSPDGKRLATTSDDATAILWDASSGEQLRTLAGTSVAFSPDGQRLATGSEESLQVWETATGLPVLTIQVGVDSLAFSPDGTRLAAVTGSTATLWDARTGQEQLSLAGHADWIMSLAFSPDGENLVTTSLDQTARVWSVSPGEEALTLARAGSLVAYSPDGARLATDGVDGISRLWDRQSGAQVATFPGHEAGLLSLTFNPDGQRLATGSLDQTARIWDLSSGKAILTLQGHSMPVRDVAFSPDGRWIATAGFDGVAKVWQADSGLERLTLQGHNGLVTGVAFNPDSHSLATSSTDATAKIWSVPSGELLHTLSGHNGPITDLAFSKDGSRLVTASRDATARIWDAHSAAELLVLSGHRADIWSVKVSPDGRAIATASADNTARLWDAASGEQILTLPGSLGGVTDVAFSPRAGNAELAVASADGAVRVYLLSLQELLALAQRRLTRTLSNGECKQYLHLAVCPE